MRSSTVACVALAAIGLTLGSVALLSNPTRMLGASYEKALAMSGGKPTPAQVAAATGPGSEHFWLTRPVAEPVKPASVEQTAPAEADLTIADIRKALVVAGEAATGSLEVVSIKEVGRISLGGTGRMGKAALVTVRIGGGDHEAGRIVSFVIDGAASSSAARAL